ncbi:AAA family ATPase [Blastococcus sp. PRF04-17]|uniref:AAA family ATPase n=1 Tax=Blastococcus sp. PRF04-17 TaxID=2933797 RepID=UPI001FF0F3E6|nr:AAA family ATPase [Blastococcus sp. PRF04-17]UOY02061.1 AAA family ATPase [Blastococcus sp. PRF04-17]
MALAARPAEDAAFVGRSAELAELAAGIAAAAAGRGGLLLLSGPAGIGKTRTVEEATARAPAVVWGRCVDDPGAPPMWPWRRVARTLPGVRAALAGTRSGLDVPGGGPPDPESARFALVAGTAEALLEAAEADGLVVVLEDLHWADETSLRLLRHLAGELPRSRLLVVATYRDPSGAAVGSPLDRALPDLLRWPTSRVLSLAPLTEDDVRAYLRGAPEEAVRLALRRSGGNPLYLRAIARAPATGNGQDGQELRHLVRTTLSALSPAVLDLLDTAAVLGEELDPGQLGLVTGRPPDEVRDGLDAAVRAGVLAAVPDAPGRRRFVHAVVRGAIYDDLSPSAREELHRRAAEALEPLAEDDDHASGPVAGHWLRATSEPRTLRRAAAWARRAAEAATRSLAFDEAARFLAMAWGAAQRAGVDPADRAELLLALARAEFRAGRFAESLGHATAASDAAAECGRNDLLAPAALTVQDVAAPGFPRRCSACASGPSSTRRSRTSRPSGPASSPSRPRCWPTPAGWAPRRGTRSRRWHWRRRAVIPRR